MAPREGEGKGANWRGEKKAGGVPHFLGFLEELASSRRNGRAEG